MILLSIIIPTLNEEENILKLFSEIKTVGLMDYEIIIVDDNSHDKTRNLSEQLGAAKVIHRIGCKGIVSAFMDGFRYSQGEYVALMDADLQHPPKLLDEMLGAFLYEHFGYDLVVGSRFIKGGSVAGWDWKRKLESWVARWLCHHALKETRGVEDIVSGFFMVKRCVLDDLKEKWWFGWKVLPEILVRVPGLNVLELPYKFQIREGGASKLKTRVIFDYVKQLRRLQNL